MKRNLFWVIALLLGCLLVVSKAGAAAEGINPPSLLLVDDFEKGDFSNWKTIGTCELTSAEGVKPGTKALEAKFGALSKGDYSSISYNAYNSGFGEKSDPGIYKSLSFWVKGDGKPHEIIVTIWESVPPKGHEKFQSYIMITSNQWEKKVLSLEKIVSRKSGACHNGYFRYVKSRGDTDKVFTPGNKIYMIGFIVLEPDITLSIDQVEFSAEPLKITTKPKKKDLKTFSLKKPYTFYPKRSRRSFYLVKNRSSTYQIILPSSPSSTGKFAAEELQKYIEKATEAKLPIAYANLPLSPQKVIIAKRDENQRLFKDSFYKKAADPEGFTIRTFGKNSIVIEGGSERGMLYGVYTFLENALGIRWFEPGELGEVIPENKNALLHKIDHTEIPAFPSYRCFHYCSHHRARPSRQRFVEVMDWCVKNKYNVELERVKDEELVSSFYACRGGCIPLSKLGTGHNFQKLISPDSSRWPTKEYFKKHPEYFPLNAATGKRVWKRGQICTTNPDVIKIITGKVIEYSREHPDEKYLFVCQEDGTRQWCECPECRKLDTPGVQPGTSIEMANRNIYLVNAVANRLKRLFPDKFIITYAYGVTLKPPTLVKPAENVAILFCPPHGGGLVNTDYGLRWLKEWAAMSKEVWTYNYLSLNYSHIFCSDESIPQDMRYYHQNGVRGMNMESCESWGMEGMEYYMATRLMWDIKINDKLLLEDYFKKYYGRSASYVKDFRRIYNKVFQDEKCYVQLPWRSFPIFSEEQLKKMTFDLEEAGKNADSSLVIKRIARQEMVLEYINLYQDALLKHKRFMKQKSEKNANVAIEAYQKVSHFHKTYRKQEIVSLYNDRRVQGLIKSIGTELKQYLSTSKMLEKYEKVGDIPKVWKFKLDPKNIGEKEKWFSSIIDDTPWAEIKIGNAWESQGYPYDGFAWYRTYIEIPGEVKGKQIRLYFEAVDEKAWIYIDGNFIGGHYEGDVGNLWVEPFSVDITKAVIPGKTHLLAVKVHDSGGAGGIWKPVFLFSPR